MLRYFVQALVLPFEYIAIQLAAFEAKDFSAYSSKAGL
jgi:hypothetical protein